MTETLQHNYNVGGFFIWNVGEDDKNSSRHVIQLDQGGLTLSTRDQYINKSIEDDPVLSALLQVMVQTSLMLYKEKKNLSSIEDISDIITGDITRQMKDIIDFCLQTICDAPFTLCPSKIAYIFSTLTMSLCLRLV